MSVYEIVTTPWVTLATGLPPGALTMGVLIGAVAGWCSRRRDDG